MCGLEDTAGEENFPKWYNELFAKHQGQKGKSQIIATVIEKRYICDDTEVLLYPALVKKIVNRDWTLSDIGKRAD